MLTPEQLETLREKWRLAVTGSQRRRYMNEGVPTLFAHIDELQALLRWASGYPDTEQVRTAIAELEAGNFVTLEEFENRLDELNAKEELR